MGEWDWHTGSEMNARAPELYERYLVPALFGPWRTIWWLWPTCTAASGFSIWPAARVWSRVGHERHSVRVALSSEATSTGTCSGLPAGWSSIEDSPGFDVLANAIGSHIGADAAAGLRRGPFGYDPRDDLEPSLVDAGFSEVRVQEREKLVRFPSPTEFVGRYALSTPIASAFSEADQSARTRLIDEVAAELQEFTSPAELAFPHRCLSRGGHTVDGDLNEGRASSHAAPLKRRRDSVQLRGGISEGEGAPDKPDLRERDGAGSPASPPEEASTGNAASAPRFIRASLFPPA